MFPSSHKIKDFRPWVWLAISLVLLILTCSVALGRQGPWLTYKGAWFSISYPPDFTVRPGQRSATSIEGYDSVFFRSPDGRVEFYVFSPQWMGDLREMEMNPATEVLVDEKKEQGKGKQVRWLTIRAKDRSYYKSFVDEITSNNTRTVFGIIYRDQNAYQNYWQDYLHFKESLRQYTD